MNGTPYKLSVRPVKRVEAPRSSIRIAQMASYNPTGITRAAVRTIAARVGWRRNMVVRLVGPLGGTGMAAVGAMRAKPGASASNSTPVTKNGVSLLPNSATTAPSPGPIRKPAVRTPISLPSSSPARSGSRVVTKACAAGSNAPSAAPLIARAATSCQTSSPSAKPTAPSEPTTMAPTISSRPLPRSASGARPTWPNTAAKRPAELIRPMLAVERLFSSWTS